MFKEAKKRALVVDDNAFNIMVVQKILEELKFMVLTANNGEEAIALLEH